MSYATRNENGDNMGNSFVRCPIDCSRADFAKRWDDCFGLPRVKPGPQASVQRKDGSIVTTFEREVSDRPWLGD